MSAELKAGMFVLVALGALVYMTTRLTQTPFAFKGVKTYYANISDATGLLSKTKVKMAGLDVGQLEKLELVGKRARITVQIASDLVLHKDATVGVKAIGFLGDKYLELWPGSESAPVLEEGGYISEGAVTGSLDQLTQKTSQLVDNLKDITDLLKEALKGGKQGEGEEGISRLDRILDNMEKFSEGLAEMDKLGDLADRLADVADNVKSITNRVNKGEGTIGKLLNDTETVDKLNETLSGVNKLVSKANRMEVLIDVKSAAMVDTGGANTRFALILQPTFDKYYLLGGETRPQGVTTVKKTVTTVDPGQPDAQTVTTQRDKTNVGGFGINAQFAKRFGDLWLRFGLFETNGGVAVDYQFFEDKVKLTGELYRFAAGSNPQVNLQTEAFVYQPIYIWGGMDFVLTPQNRSWFVGAGLRFTDQDLKALFGAVATAAAR
jgi:phospholipid/cholesterol/gamma-HCH transport system substrate-binding protein